MFTVTRKEEVMAIKSKFPTKIPVSSQFQTQVILYSNMLTGLKLIFLFQLIVERYYKERNLPTLDKTKFLVPEDITMSQFLVIIRNRVKIKANQVCEYNVIKIIIFKKCEIVTYVDMHGLMAKN